MALSKIKDIVHPPVFRRALRSSRTRKLTERDIERHLVRRAKERGGEVRKVRWVGRNGAPDRLWLSPLYFSVWIELKAPGEKPTAAQLREHDRMRECGQVVVVIDSLEAVNQVIR